MDALSIVDAIILSAQQAMEIISDISLGFGSIIAGTTLVFALALSATNGFQGASHIIVRWAIATGLLMGAITLWDELMFACFDFADQVAVALSGTSVSALDVIAMGADLFARAVDAGVTGAIWAPWNWLQHAQMVGASAFMFLAFLWLSLTVAIAVISFWMAGAIAVLLVPFAYISGMGGVGFGAIVLVLGHTLRLIAVMFVVGITGELVEAATIPAEGEDVTWSDVLGAAVTTFVVAALAWSTSRFVSDVARSHAGGMGVMGMAQSSVMNAAAAFAPGMGMAGSAARGAGGAAAGGSGGSGGSAGSAASGASRGAAGRSSGGPVPRRG
jgi:hypothetical protein